MYLARTGYNPKYGARELRRTVELLLHEPMSMLILNGELQKNKKWQFICDETELKLTPLKGK